MDISDSDSDNNNPDEPTMDGDNFDNGMSSASDDEPGRDKGMKVGLIFSGHLSKLNLRISYGIADFCCRVSESVNMCV